ncbi:hypothetical protein [Sorangium sp. So ce117]|uniref:hypothetical protein n=1 Tax=Sorangium sp. So ce117 TaxID=3133277 RepID=UPI003F5EC2C0
MASATSSPQILAGADRTGPTADGTVAVDMDPLSLLCRLAASVPPPRFHTVKYAGVLASASRPRWRASASDRALRSQKSLRRRTMTPLRNASVAAIERSTNRAELLRRTFAIDVDGLLVDDHIVTLLGRDAADQAHRLLEDRLRELALLLLQLCGRALLRAVLLEGCPGLLDPERA